MRNSAFTPSRGGAASLALLVCLLLSAAVCHADGDAASSEGSGGTAYQEALDGFREKGVTIALGEDGIPLAYLDSAGRPAGIAVDVWQLWGSRMGIPVRFVFRPFDASLEALAQGEVDMHGGVYFSEERARLFDFTRPFIDAESVLAVRRATGLDCENVLTDGVVAVLRDGYAEHFLLNHYPHARYAEYPVTDEVVAAFLKGDTNAVIVGLGVLALATDNVLPGDVTICRTIYSRGLHGAVLHGNDMLLRALNKGLDEMGETELQRIEDRWHVTADQGQSLTWVVLLAAMLIILVGVVVVWFLRRR